MIVDILRADVAGKKGQKKRFWSDEEKVSICAQTCAPEVSVGRLPGGTPEIVVNRRAVSSDLSP